MRGRCGGGGGEGLHAPARCSMLRVLLLLPLLHQASAACYKHVYPGGTSFEMGESFL